MQPRIPFRARRGFGGKTNLEEKSIINPNFFFPRESSWLRIKGSHWKSGTSRNEQACESKSKFIEQQSPLRNEQAIENLK